jgi:TPR repeat protein
MIQTIYCIHHGSLTTIFEHALLTQNLEAQKPVFTPHWRDEKDPTVRSLRRQAHVRWTQAADRWSAQLKLPKSPTRKEALTHVKVMPLWHGSDQKKCESIASTGFTFFGKHAQGKDLSTDEGYFGSGIYFTNSAKYAANIYSDGQNLLLAWVSMREPYPVVNDKPHPQPGSDMTMLKGRGAFENYNAHYVPVAPIDPKDPTCALYYPCYQEPPVCDEVVVFKDSQTVLRYWVVLQVALPGSVEQLTQKTFTSNAALFNLVLDLLKQPSIHEHTELSAFLGKKIGQVAILPSSEGLSAEHATLYQELSQLLDHQKKVNTALLHKLLPSPSASSITPVMSSLKLTSSSLDVLYVEAKRFEAGEGVPQDSKKADHWYQKAADQGFASAQFNLGWCYANGQGVPQDYSQAVRWYQKAAGQGHAQAQFNLGGCYENGQGVPRNRSQAIHWYQKAADQGDRDAQAALKRLGH